MMWPDVPLLPRSTQCGACVGWIGQCLPGPPPPARRDAAALRGGGRSATLPSHIHTGGLWRGGVIGRV